jgi:transglutaminase-like putative cysteine protease
MNLADINGYTVYLNDSSVLNPFGIDAELLRTIRDETKGYYNTSDKARRLFDWFEKDIQYGKNGKHGCITGLELFRQRKGVCSEMAYLYVTMARGVGIESSFVSVDRDYAGKKVNHACAGVRLDRKYALVDPAYHAFDIKHRKWELWNDARAIQYLEYWRNK